MKNLLIAICFLSFAVGSLSAQIANDEAIIHLNKPYYVSGETVWYQLYLPNAFAGAKGNVQVMIQNKNGQVIDDMFWLMEDARLDGYFKIPYDVASDLYHFSIYAIDNNTRKPTMITNWEVPIYNDLNPQGMQAIYPERSIFTAEDNMFDLQISTDKSVVRKGENINVSVKLPPGVRGEIGSVSVSDVSLIGSAAESTVIKSRITLSDGVNLGIDERTFVHGMIADASTGQPAKIGVIGAYNPTYNKMYYTKSDDDGLFTLLLKDHVGREYLQVSGTLYDLYADTEVKLSSPSVPQDVRLIADYDDDIVAYLKESNSRKRIYQYFKEVETPVNYDETKGLEYLYVKPNKLVNVKEYVTFENTGIFFNEVLGHLIDFKKKDEKVTARLFDPESKRVISSSDEYYFPRSPVFVVDGNMTKDADYVYNLKLTDLQDVSIYNDWRDITKQFGTFGDFGYVVINTSQTKIEIPKNDMDDIVGFSGKGRDAVYPISISTSDERSAPYLQPTVYWNPEERSNSFSFKTSDDVGEFLIQMVVRDEQGKVSVANMRYKTSRALN